MATAGEIKYSCCSPCLDDGRNTAAGHYCVDCEMYFCTRCVKCHNTIPSLKKHQVNDVYSSESTALDDETTEQESEYFHRLSCTLHEGKLIDTYCNDHDVLCCGTCAVVQHRSCTTVSIAIAAKDFKASAELNKCKESLTENLVKLTEEKKIQIENIECIDKQTMDLIETVNNHEEKIISKIKELANMSRQEIRSKCEERKTALRNDIDALDVVITTTKEHVDELEQTDDEQLFVSVKISRTVTKDGKILLSAMMMGLGKNKIRFDLDETFDKNVLEMTSFGRVEDCVVNEYRATFQRSINVKRSNDSKDTRVRDICLMGSGELLLTDETNKKLKRFSSNLQYKDEILLSGSPAAVCKIDNNEVAVRIWSSKVVHIISVGQTMEIASSITLADNGYGMAYDAGTGEIFACAEDKVSVYSKNGNKLRTYDSNINGEQMFSACRQIALSVNKHYICVTDKTEGLIFLDKRGYLKMKIALSDIGDIWPLCKLPNHMYLTGSWRSGAIVQIDKDGNQVQQLTDTANVRTNTFCMVYDRKKSRLIVGGSHNLMSVYIMTAK